MNRNFIFSSVLVFTGVFVGIFLVEGLYRGWLYTNQPEVFQVSGEEHPTIWFFEKSRWWFNEAHGFEYGPETVYGGSASDGAVKSCWSWPANSRGNMGIIEGSYDEADLKVLVFGDSFTAQVETSFDPRGVTWPDFLQRKLIEETGRSAHVVNFGRDGYGILQMVDFAVDMIPEWDPDLVVFAYITDDLTRDRFWRTYAPKNGRERILTTTVPLADPPLKFSSDTAIVNKNATREWCEEAVRKGRGDDPVLNELEESVRVAQANVEGRLSVWDLSQSFIYNRLIHKNAFYAISQRTRPSQNPRHENLSFADDARYVENVRRIRDMDVPLLFVHFSTGDELLLGKEFVFASPQEKSLNDSLSRTIGKPVYLTMGSADVPEEGYTAIKRSPNDAHPGVVGMRFYADVVIDALIKSRLISP